MGGTGFTFEFRQFLSEVVKISNIQCTKLPTWQLDEKCMHPFPTICRSLQCTQNSIVI